MWNTLVSQVAGRQHMDTDRHCQDRFLVHQAGDRLIVAVADGHGGDPYCRSDMGAQFACEAALEVLTDENVDYAQAYITIKEIFDKKVADHLSGTPMTQQEQELLKNTPAQYAYGTTLLCTMLSPEGVYRCHLGDGEIHVLDIYGHFLPDLPEDPHCIAGFTSSMVSETAVVDARWDYTPTPAAVAVLFTDGYEPGGSRPWGLLELVHDSQDTIPTQLLEDGWNGDDQTVVMAVDTYLCGTEAFSNRVDQQKQRQILLDRADLIHRYLKETDIYIRFLIQKLAKHTNPQERGALIEKLCSRQKRFDMLTAAYKQALFTAAQEEPVSTSENIDEEDWEPLPFD